MRYMGLDLGSKTLGVSLSDPSGIIASSYETFRFQEGEYALAIQYVLQLIESMKVGTIVLGHPKNMDGSQGFQAKVSEDFQGALKVKTPVPVILWDERLTTKMARQVMVDTKTKRKDKNMKVDQLAATVLLQSYLDSRR